MGGFSDREIEDELTQEPDEEIPLDEDDASRDEIEDEYTGEFPDIDEDGYSYGSDDGLEEYIRETGLYDGNMDGFEKGYDY